MRLTLAGIRRRVGVAPRQVRPLVLEDVRAMVEALPPGIRSTRDRCLLLVGFAGGMRRSELVALDVGDASIEGPGLRITIRRSKTDQDGAG